MKKYPSHTVRDLLKTGLISPQTKKNLNERLEQLNEKYEPEFLSRDAFNLLRVISNRLIPQADDENYIDLAASIDRRLKEGKSDGWRYASMPPDGESYETGLKAVNAIAKNKYHQDFVELSAEDQDKILSDVQKENVDHEAWKKVSPKHFFEELLAELTESYYSHPLAQEEIGFVGMADMQGWENTGLNEPDDHEPEEIK